jgi:catalase
MDNIAAAMAGVPEQMLRRQIAHFAKADPAYGAGVAARVGVLQPVAAE